jgi:PAS domain S-box-containing protein
MMSLFEASPEPMWIIAQGRFIDCNDAAAKALGHPDKFSVIGSSPAEISPEHQPDGELSEAKAALLLKEAEEGTSQRFEWTHLRADGAPFIAEVALAASVLDGRVVVLGVWHDITARKMSEKALFDSDVFARSILNAFRSHVCVLDRRGVIVAVNQAWRRFLDANDPGHDTLDYFVGHNYLDVCDATTGTGKEHALAMAAAEGIRSVIRGDVDDFEWEYPCHAPREERWFQGKVTRFPDNSGHVVLAHENITTRKVAERALAESEARFRQFFEDNSSVMLLIEPGSGIIVSANASAATFYGYPLDRLVGMNIDAINTLSPEAVALERQLAARQKRNYFNFHHRLASGEVRDVEVYSTPTQVGGARRLFSIVHDITDRNVAEASLHESEARFRLMADSAPVLIWVAGTDKGCFWFNKVWLEFTGRTLTQEEGNGWLEGVHPEDRQRCLDIYTGHFDRRQPFNMEYRLRRHDGEYRWLSDQGIPRFDEQGNFEGCIGCCIDITAIREARERLQASHDLLDRLTVNLPGTLYQFQLFSDGRSCFPYASNGIEEVYEVTPEEVKLDASAVFARLHPEDLATVTATILESARTLSTWRLEYRVNLPRRGVRWLSGEARPEKQPDGSVLWHGYITDITRVKTAALALAESEAQFQVLSDMGAAGVYVLQERQFVFANPALCAMTGYARQELFCLDFLDFIHPEHRALVEERALGRQEGKDVPARYEFKLVTKAGETRWVELNAGRIPFHGQSSSIGTVYDITERKHMENALRESEERHRLLADNADDVIWTMDAQLQFSYVSPSVEKLRGFTVSEVMQQPFPEVITPESATIVMDAFAQGLAALEDGRVFPGFRGEIEQPRKDGTTVWTEVSVSGLYGATGDFMGILGVSRDITERKVLSREIALRQAELEELNQSLEARVAAALAELREKDRMLIVQGRQAAMGEMIGNVAHQWRQPLNALGLVLSNLKDAQRFEELTPQVLDKAVSDGNLLVQKMSSTINDFRNFFRPDKAKSAFSALTQVRQAVALVDAAFQNSKVRIHVDAPSDVELFGFPNEYSQVVLNILGNAQQAIRDSGQDDGLVSITVSRQGGSGCVAVRDNGGGIPGNIIDRLFEPYFSTKEMGTGIGLHMSRQIVEHMGGTLVARNITGGAEFTIRTPLAQEAA